MGYRDLVRLVMEWTEQSLESPDATETSVACISALGSVLVAFQSQVSSQTQSALKQLFCLALAKYRIKSPTSLTRRSENISASADLCQAAADGLHFLFASRSENRPETIASSLDTVIDFLQRHKDTENIGLARMYESLFRTLSTLISDVGGIQIRQVPLLVEIASSFLTFGVSTAAAQLSYSDSTSDLSSESSGSRYVPPHRRCGYSSATSSNPSGTNPSKIYPPFKARPVCAGSDTSGTGYKSLDYSKASKVRLAALNLIQRLSQQDGKSLHPYWRTILPTRQPLQRSPSAPHLITVLLYDPHPQVRMAAAGVVAVMLEGKAQKNFIAMASISDKETTIIRGFNSLSLSLGRMVLCLHDGLLYALENEEKASVLPHLFRTLNGLIAITPYDRMPSDLRTRIASCLKRQWTVYHGQADGDVSRETACLIALRSVIGSQGHDQHLKEYLSDRNQLAHEHCSLAVRVEEFAGVKIGWSLIDALMAVSATHRDIVRAESLAALASIAANYSSLLRDNNLGTTGAEEKAAQQAVHLLGSLLADESLENDTEFSQYAVKTVQQYIVPLVNHPSAVLRSASLAEVGGARPSLLKSIPPRDIQQLTDDALSIATTDPVPSVRSAACKMIGDFVNAGFCIYPKEVYDRTVSVLASCQSNKTISVRISASWSLANIADAIARQPEGLAHISRDAQSFQPLAMAAVSASRDHEKVRANGIRALGHLLRETTFPASSKDTHPGPDREETVNWLGDAVDCLKCSLRSGSAKVKWNACYAAGSLAFNPSLTSIVGPDGTLSQLVGQFVHLINENPNFKVQMQAAAAICNISDRQLFRDNFFPAISAVARRLHILLDGSDNKSADSESDLIQPTVDASFPNFKYHEGLKSQLELTLLHLIGLLDGPFSDRCVFPRPDALYVWISKCIDRAKESEEQTDVLLKALKSLEKHEAKLADWTEMINSLCH